MEKYKHISERKSGLRIGMINANGLCSHGKQRFILEKMFQKDKVDIAVMVDARIKEEEVKNSIVLGNKTTYTAEPIIKTSRQRTSRSRGLLVVQNSLLDIKMENFVIIKQGNLASIDVTSQFTEKFKLHLVYGPNQDDFHFFQDMMHSMQTAHGGSIAIGDFNVHLNPAIDIQPPRPGQRLESKAVYLNGAIEDGYVTDLFRHFAPDSATTSYMHNSQWELRPRERNKSRVDLGLATPNLVHCVTGVEYVRFFTKKLDHKALYVDINKGTFTKPIDPPYKIPNKILNNEVYNKKMSDKLNLYINKHKKQPFSENDLPLKTNFEINQGPFTVTKTSLFQGILDYARN